MGSPLPRRLIALALSSLVVFSLSAIVAPSAFAAAPTVTVGAVSPNTSFSPAGFVMQSSSDSFTISVTVTTPGSGSPDVNNVTITSSGSSGASPRVFQATGSSGSGGGGTWSVSSAGAGSIVFHASATPDTTPITFTVRVVDLTGVPAASGYRTDSFFAKYQKSSAGGASSTTPATNTLKRYSLEISDVSPPASSASAGQTLNPVESVVNHSSASQTLTAASIGGTAFSGTGSRGSLPTIGSGATGTVTFTGATITGSTGSKAVTGDAANGTTA